MWWGIGEGFHTCSDVLLEKRCEDEEGKERAERESFRTVLCVRLSGQTKPSPSHQNFLSDSVTESVSLSLEQLGHVVGNYSLTPYLLTLIPVIHFHWYTIERT